MAGKRKMSHIEPMFRRDLIDLLMNKVMTVPQLAREVGEAPKDVASDFRHLVQSLRHTEFEPVIVPAECRKCGFEFSEDKLLKPSKCPKCNSTWIYPPQIGVRVANKGDGIDG
jgi:predicted Zn-ribbon and HTH transcriptional regulator